MSDQRERFYAQDFGLPHRDSEDGKSIEYPITIDQSVLEFGDSSRKDAGKDAGFWLIPPDSLTQLAKVFDIGAKKYSPRGWETGMAWSRVLDPMFRHILKWMKGEKYDQTDGQHHLASVAWACLVLMEYERTHPELDDLKRPNVSA